MSREMKILILMVSSLSIWLSYKSLKDHFAGPHFTNIDEWVSLDRWFVNYSNPVSNMDYTPVKPKTRVAAINDLQTSSFIELSNEQALWFGGRLIEEGEICYLTRGVAVSDDPDSISLRREGEKISATLVVYRPRQVSMVKWPIIYYTKRPISHCIVYITIWG